MKNAPPIYAVSAGQQKNVIMSLSHPFYFSKGEVKMSVKIRVSFSTQKELQGVLVLLSPRIKSFKIKKGAEGQYSKAYIEIKE